MTKKIKPYVLGIIHARGGSVRIPLKNIKPLNGKPLIAHMIGAALGSKLLDRVIVSTDHQEIKRVALEYGAEVPFDRPKEIAIDCPSELVTQHAVDFVERDIGRKVDIAVTMQPTTPFVRSEDIDACVRMLMDNPGWGSVFSAKMVMERPEWMFTRDDDGTGRLFVQGSLMGERGVFQTLPEMVIPNGAAYATRRSELTQGKGIISENTGVHVMSLERSVDIDEPVDFEFAEFLAKKMERDNG